MAATQEIVGFNKSALERYDESKPSLGIQRPEMVSVKTLPVAKEQLAPESARLTPQYLDASSANSRDYDSSNAGDYDQSSNAGSVTRGALALCQDPAATVSDVEDFGAEIVKRRESPLAHEEPENFDEPPSMGLTRPAMLAVKTTPVELEQEHEQVALPHPAQIQSEENVLYNVANTDSYYAAQPAVAYAAQPAQPVHPAIVQRKGVQARPGRVHEIPLGVTLKGRVNWFSDKLCYGFINTVPDTGRDFFAHIDDIKALSWRTLQEGEEVEFELKWEENRYKAINITGPNGDYVKGLKGLRHENRQNPAAPCTCRQHGRPAQQAAPRATFGGYPGGYPAPAAFAAPPRHNAGRPRSRNVCYDFQKNACHRGTCKFVHERPPMSPPMHDVPRMPYGMHLPSFSSSLGYVLDE